jgi:ferritin-like protein
MKNPKEMVQDKLAQKHINRTGIALSPKLSQEMIEGAKETQPSSPGDEKGIAAVRAAYGSGGDLIGSMPPPATPKGIAKTAMKALTGQHASVLLDKMGARLAFERTGTRLYESIIAKLESAEPIQGGPTLARLEQIRREEQEHFEMLQRAMISMGGDPTAITPSADVSAVLSMGVPQVLNDARTTMAQGLEAILIAELADNDGWAVLVDLARAMGQDELAADFERALREEEEHLRDVRAWIHAGTMAQAGVAKGAKGATAQQPTR